MNITEVIHSKQWVRNGDLEIKWDGEYFINRNGARIQEAPLDGWEPVATMNIGEAFECGKIVCHPYLDGFWTEKLYGMPPNEWAIKEFNLETMRLFLNSGYRVTHKLYHEWSMVRDKNGAIHREPDTFLTWWDTKDGWEVFI